MSSVNDSTSPPDKASIELTRDQSENKKVVFEHGAIIMPNGSRYRVTVITAEKSIQLGLNSSHEDLTKQIVELLNRLHASKRFPTQPLSQIRITEKGVSYTKGSETKKETVALKTSSWQKLGGDSPDDLQKLYKNIIKCAAKLKISTTPPKKKHKEKARLRNKNRPKKAGEKELLNPRRSIKDKKKKVESKEEHNSRDALLGENNLELG